MIKACPICGRPIMDHCFHVDITPSVQMSVEGALNLAIQHTVILNTQVSIHLSIIKKLREGK